MRRPGLGRDLLAAQAVEPGHALRVALGHQQRLARLHVVDEVDHLAPLGLVEELGQHGVAVARRERRDDPGEGGVLPHRRQPQALGDLGADIDVRALGLVAGPVGLQRRGRDVRAELQLAAGDQGRGWDRRGLRRARRRARRGRAGCRGAPRIRAARGGQGRDTGKQADQQRGTSSSATTRARRLRQHHRSLLGGVRCGPADEASAPARRSP